MIVYAVEPYADCVDELERYLPQHWAEAEPDSDRIPYNRNASLYSSMDANGMLHVLTVRDDDEIIGYMVGIVMDSPHSMGFRICMNDAFWLRPDRRKGWTGIKMFREWEKSLRDIGVQRMLISTRCGELDMSRLFDRLGWRRLEVVYSALI